MKNKYLRWINFLTSLIIISCETSLEFELPKNDPVPAILASNDPDCVFQVRVTMAKPFQDSIVKVNGSCSVSIFEDGNFFTELSLDTSSFESIQDKFRGYPQRIFIKDPGIKFTEGKEYKITANIPGYHLLSATTSIPSAVKIKSVSWQEYEGTMPQWYWESTVETLASPPLHNAIPPLIEWTITFDDPPLIKNYYRIGVGFRGIVHKVDDNYFYADGKTQYAPTNSNDPTFMYVINRSSETNPDPDNKYYTVLTKEIIFSDYNFDGTVYSVRILTPRPSNIIQNADTNSFFKYIINLYSLSEDYYKYWLDRYHVEKLSKDPFAEPLRIHSNISNGAGIFAFSSLDTDTVQMDINY
ncbi:MAG: DUF4249 domain-containing protein [Bacteroidales bacterium]|nr:DUF4249 domain-containing protein [Bacteroidales bacterium]